jgi:hypothetical protein
MKESQINKACSTHGRDEKFIHLVRKLVRKRTLGRLKSIRNDIVKTN